MGRVRFAVQKRKKAISRVVPGNLLVAALLHEWSFGGGGRHAATAVHHIERTHDGVPSPCILWINPPGRIDCRGGREIGRRRASYGNPLFYCDDFWGRRSKRTIHLFRWLQNHRCFNIDSSRYQSIDKWFRCLLLASRCASRKLALFQVIIASYPVLQSPPFFWTYWKIGTSGRTDDTQIPKVRIGFKEDLEERSFE